MAHTFTISSGTHETIVLSEVVSQQKHISIVLQSGASAVVYDQDCATDVSFYLHESEYH